MSRAVEKAALFLYRVIEKISTGYPRILEGLGRMRGKLWGENEYDRCEIGGYLHELKGNLRVFDALLK